MKKLAFLLTFILLLAACQPIQTSDATSGSSANGAASPLAGDWQGELSIANMTVRLLVSLEESTDAWSGTFSIPQQGAIDLPLHSIGVEGSTIHMEALEGDALGVFDGELDAGGAIAGAFLQGGYEGTFTLQRIAPVAAAALPYTAEEVTFASEDANLAGTLTLPDGDGPFPAIVLVSGSGAQNRDEELSLLPGYAPFREIADRLTQNGFAVLRYDDRGFGESTGNLDSATTTTFAGDARAAIEYLRNRPDIDAAQVGILGHSEGSNVAAMVGASDPDLAFIVAWAGPAVSGKEVIVLQSGLQMEKAGGAPEDVQRYRDEFQRAVQYAASGDEEGLRIYLDNVIRAAYVQLPEEQQATLGPMEVAIAAQVEAQIAALTTPWMVEFLAYNPAEDWALVTAPVLAFYGGLDTQVDANQNIAPLKVALANNPDVTVETLATANHLFVAAETGAVSEYPLLQPNLLPEFLDTLTTWLQEHTSAGE